MNFQETIALIEMLKASGVTKYKSHEHEIELSLVPRGTEAKVQVSKDPVSKEAEAQATEKLKNLINTISMSPEELANQIFPDGAL